MAAIGRIRLGLAEGEFWRLTPRQFTAYMDEWGECERRRWAPARFVATACALAAGHYVNYMEEPEPELDPAGADQRASNLEAWLKARAAPPKPLLREQVKDSGGDGHDCPDDLAPLGDLNLLL